VTGSAKLEEIIDGLLLPEKVISPKYFYDERGSQLFDQITHLPEYYPTETELLSSAVAQAARRAYFLRTSISWQPMYQ